MVYLKPDWKQWTTWTQWMRDNLNSPFWDRKDHRWDYASECADMVEEEYKTPEQLQDWLREQDEMLK